jgi:hypothetical protein
MLLPDEWPAGETFDLIVLSEIGYFIDLPAWQQVCRLAATSLAEDGSLVACHWQHSFAERRVDTSVLHAELDAALQAKRAVSLDDQDFLLDVWSRARLSPAQRDGRR